jgi:serine/threonine protein kinase
VCDVKPANLLVCELRAPGCHRITIADFGSAVQYAAGGDNIVRVPCGSRLTWAPEMHDLDAALAGKGDAGSRCTSQIDVYALGCLAAATLLKMPRVKFDAGMIAFFAERFEPIGKLTCTILNAIYTLPLYSMCS